MKLLELATVFKGIAITKANLDPTAGAPHRVIQCHDMIRGAVAPRSTLRTVYLGNPARLVVLVGDILVALASEQVTIVALKKRLDCCVPDVHVAVVRPLSRDAGARIFKYLTSEGAQSQLKLLKRGAVVRRVFTRDLQQLDVP
jgi:hypothetical protein